MFAHKDIIQFSGGSYLKRCNGNEKLPLFNAKAHAFNYNEFSEEQHEKITRLIAEETRSIFYLDHHHYRSTTFWFGNNPTRWPSSLPETTFVEVQIELPEIYMLRSNSSGWKNYRHSTMVENISYDRAKFDRIERRLEEIVPELMTLTHYDYLTEPPVSVDFDFFAVSISTVIVMVSRIAYFIFLRHGYPLNCKEISNI